MFVFFFVWQIWVFHRFSIWSIVRRNTICSKQSIYEFNLLLDYYQLKLCDSLKWTPTNWTAETNWLLSRWPKSKWEMIHLFLVIWLLFTWPSMRLDCVLIVLAAANVSLSLLNEFDRKSCTNILFNHYCLFARFHVNSTVRTVCMHMIFSK